VPEAPATPLQTTEVLSLLDEIRSQDASVQRYQGLLRVRGRSSEGAFDARLAVWFERPDRLRVELLGAFGGTRWSAVASREGITAYFPAKKHYLREPDVSDVVGRLLGIRLSPEDMMAALSGAGIALDTSPAAEGHRRGALRFLEIAAPSRPTVELNDGGQVVSARSERYRVSYPSAWKRRGRLFPDELTLENESVRARLETAEVDVNTELDPETFVIAIPGDAVRLRPADVGSESVFVVAREPS
jgi:hypothetical protein